MADLVEKVIQKMWSQYDKDQNGYLDLEESIAYTKATLKEIQKDDYVEPTQDELQKNFDKYDTDHNKKIDKQEVCMYIRAKCGVPEDHCSHYDEEGHKAEEAK